MLIYSLKIMLIYAQCEMTATIVTIYVSIWHTVYLILKSTTSVENVF